MSKAVRIQATDRDGNVIHEFPSIAAAVAAGHSATTINRQICHGGRAVDGLLWRRASGPVVNPLTMLDRLEALANRLEDIARQLCNRK